MNQFLRARARLLTLGSMILAAMLLASVSGCGGSTPSSATRDMVQLLSDRKFGEAYDSFSSTSPVRVMDQQEFISKMEAVLPEGSTITEFSVTEEKIDESDDSRARVEWKAKVNLPDAGEQPLDDSYSVVREDDTWKVEE